MLQLFSQSTGRLHVACRPEGEIMPAAIGDLNL
jgi:hypothetical protein